jgi:gamma-glutamyltranspeptidase/glutathione hydrolase
VAPLHVPYRDTVAYNLPPNTQGMASLEILNILNNFDMSKIPEGSADYYHVIVEATKEAFVDRDKYLSDPDFVKIPLDFLLSSKHGKDQAARIRMDAAAHELKPLDPKGDTVWFGVVDKDGNAVSIIQSIYHDFGSGIVPAGTGVLLQNRGSFFSLDPQSVNHLEPGKRTFHTLNPAMLLKGGKPYLVYGTMGGEGQPQTQAAIVTRVVDYGMTPQEAINAPRWLHGRTWGASSNDTKFEGRIPADVTDELKRRGHPVKVVENYTDTMGHAGAILIDPATKVRYGATDPRGDGVAAGY